MRISNATKGTELASDARAATTFWSRLRGLLGRARLRPGEALLIEPCSSVHTAFMRFPIDVVYVTKSGEVAKTVPNLRPFRVSALWRGGRSVIELPTGVIAATRTEPGDRLVFEP